MYHTPDGDRMLLGAERRLFVHSLAMIVGELSEGDAQFGYQVFDSLQPSQKFAILYQAARALLDAEEPMPKLTAVLEGAVATVYQYIRNMVIMEIDVPEVGNVATSFRSLVRDAALETGVTDQPPRKNSCEQEEWDILIDCLEESVLWDNDFADQYSLDADPETSERMKELLGIDDDYYVEVAPDPADDEIESCLQGLRQLTSEAQ